MSARYLNIVERTRPYELAPVRAADFVLNDDDAAEAHLVDAQVVLAVLARDSQEGTTIAQTQQGNFDLNDAVIAEIQAAIDWHPVIDRVDFIVPGTIELGEHRRE